MPIESHGIPEHAEAPCLDESRGPGPTRTGQQPVPARGRAGEPCPRTCAPVGPCQARHLVAAAAIAAGLVLWGQPLGAGPLCLALSVLAATALAADRGGAGLGLSVALPAGFLVLVAWVITWGVVTRALGLGAWETRGAALAGMLIFVACTGAVAVHRGGAVELRPADGCACGFRRPVRLLGMGDRYTTTRDLVTGHQHGYRLPASSVDAWRKSAWAELRGGLLPAGIPCPWMPG